MKPRRWSASRARSSINESDAMRRIRQRLARRAKSLLFAMLLVFACCRNQAARNDSWTLHGGFGGIGLIAAAVRCGDLVFLADAQSTIRPVNIIAHQELPPLSLESSPNALAADCGHQILYPVFRQSTKSGPTVAAIRFPSGDVLRQYPLDVSLVRGSYFRPPDSLFVAALVHEGPDTTPSHVAEAVFANTHLGIRLSLATGEVERVFAPYEQPCIGGAATCLDVRLAPGASRWLVAQPTSTHVGVYDAVGVLSRTIDITSPGFRRTGRVLDTPRAEERVRWMAENSSIAGVFQFAQHFATAHARPNLPPGWTLGQPVSFSVLMNVHSYAGALVRADVDLPGLPIGQDEEGVFAVSYGTAGQATLWRIAVL